jgi:hypothetical protein
MLSPYSYLRHETSWLLAIGQRLRVEYDAMDKPMPPRNHSAPRAAWNS